MMGYLVGRLLGAGHGTIHSGSFLSFSHYSSLLFIIIHQSKRDFFSYYSFYFFLPCISVGIFGLLFGDGTLDLLIWLDFDCVCLYAARFLLYQV